MPGPDDLQGADIAARTDVKCPFTIGAPGRSSRFFAYPVIGQVQTASPVDHASEEGSLCPETRGEGQPIPEMEND
jgi:hypothetical protein